MRDLSIKQLHRDPDALLGIAALVALALVPDATFARITENAGLFAGIAVTVLGGRFGVRAVGSYGTARVAEMRGFVPEVVAAGGVLLEDVDLDAMEALR
jgi:hypothetical protein